MAMQGPSRRAVIPSLARDLALKTTLLFSCQCQRILAPSLYSGQAAALPAGRGSWRVEQGDPNPAWSRRRSHPAMEELLW
jgi:hypothetical protein